MALIAKSAMWLFRKKTIIPAIGISSTKGNAKFCVTAPPRDQVFPSRLDQLDFLHYTFLDLTTIFKRLCIILLLIMLNSVFYIRLVGNAVLFKQQYSQLQNNVCAVDKHHCSSYIGSILAAPCYFKLECNCQDNLLIVRILLNNKKNRMF